MSERIGRIELFQRIGWKVKGPAEDDMIEWVSARVGVNSAASEPYMCRVEISRGDHFSPDDARALATALLDAAELAEKLAEDARRIWERGNGPPCSQCDETHGGGG